MTYIISQATFSNQEMEDILICYSLCFQTVDDFERRLKGLLRPNYESVDRGIMPEGYLEAPLAYDAIWAVALGK